MTCIVAVEVGDGSVIVGCDSFVGNEFQKSIIDRPKLHTNGCVTMLFAGSVRVPQALAAMLSFPKKLPPEVNPSEFMHSMIPAIREVLDGAGASGKDSDGDTVASELIFAIGGEVYMVQSDLAVLRYACGYMAGGAGASYATGALHALGKTRRRTEAGVRAALRAATEHCTMVSGPIHVRTVW